MPLIRGGHDYRFKQYVASKRASKRPRSLTSGSAQMPAAIRRVAKGLVEIKASVFVDNVAAVAGSTNGASSLSRCTNIAVGTGPSGRDGNTIKTKGMQYSLFMSKPTNIGIAVTRFILFRWDQSYRTPGVADILVSPSVYSVYNHNATKQYKVLVDNIYHLIGEVNIAGSSWRLDNKVVNGSFRDEKLLTFQDDTGTTSDSSYWCFFINDATASSTNSMSYSLKYIEI